MLTSDNDSIKKMVKTSFVRYQVYPVKAEKTWTHFCINLHQKTNDNDWRQEPQLLWYMKISLTDVFTGIFSCYNWRERQALWCKHSEKQEKKKQISVSHHRLHIPISFIKRSHLSAFPVLSVTIHPVAVLAKEEWAEHHHSGSFKLHRYSGFPKAIK